MENTLISLPPFPQLTRENVALFVLFKKHISRSVPWRCASPWRRIRTDLACNASTRWTTAPGHWAATFSRRISGRRSPHRGSQNPALRRCRSRRASPRRPRSWCSLRMEPLFAVSLFRGDWLSLCPLNSRFPATSVAVNFRSLFERDLAPGNLECSKKSTSLKLERKLAGRGKEISLANDFFLSSLTLGEMLVVIRVPDANCTIDHSLHGVERELVVGHLPRRQQASRCALQMFIRCENRKANR